jgi:hypothetical protein
VPLFCLKPFIFLRLWHGWLRVILRKRTKRRGRDAAAGERGSSLNNFISCRGHALIHQELRKPRPTLQPDGIWNNTGMKPQITHRGGTDWDVYLIQPSTFCKQSFNLRNISTSFNTTDLSRADTYISFSVCMCTVWQWTRFIVLFSSLVTMDLRPCHSSGGYSPGSSPGQVMWDLWWTKWHWGRFSPSSLVSSANSHSTHCSTFIIYHPGLVQ